MFTSKEKTCYKDRQKFESFKISLIYFIIGISWILFSDKTANKLISNKDVLAKVSSYKGVVYVLVTSYILYILIVRLLKKNASIEKQLFESNAELTAAHSKLHRQIEELNLTSSKLFENERRLLKAQAIGSIGNWEIDLQKNQMWASKQAFLLYGMITENDGIMPLKDAQKVVVNEDRAKLDNALASLLEDNSKYDVEFRIKNTGMKEERYIHSMAELEYDDNGKPVRVLGVIQDITDNKLYELKLMNANEELTALYEELAATEEELRQQLDELQTSQQLLELSEERFKILVNNSEDIIYSCDTKGVFTTVNDRFSEITNLSVNGIIGRKISEIFSNSTFIKLWENAFSKVITNGETVKFEHEDNEDKIISVTLSPLFNNRNCVVGVTGTNHNITAFRKSEKIIKRLAFYDDLTGLPNRVSFFEKIKNEIDIHKLSDDKMLILFIDLDNFKRINDSLGHAFGDELLKEVAKRLKSSIRDCDIVARLSGDEFSIIINDMNNLDESIQIIEKILKVFHEPFHIGNSSINMTSSIGVSVFPNDGEKVEDLIRSADSAMYKAKENGKNCYKFFNVGMKNEIIRKLNIEVMLRKGIAEGEFVLYYQPQFDAKTKKLRGLEALIRWNNPELGFLSPLEFIPIAEETGLITTIGEWVLETACSFATKINKVYGGNIIMAVNISPIQLKQNDFYDIVTKVIEKTGINPENLELEVTENIFIDNFDFAIKILNDLKRYGVKIALDDFGTGYSSLSYLKKLPIDLLKIDKSFIDEVNVSNNKNDFIDDIISLVHKLKIQALAEGVENEFQYDFLVNAEVDNIQGFYFGKPLPEADITKILDTNMETSNI